MGKISPVAAKYIVHAEIDIEGVVDRPDVIGAIFGQTEGLLGADLELRELQRSGRIGRIEVNTDTRSGKTKGEIIIPSSLDKAETAIVAAAMEIIQRIGPCNSKIKVTNIEDVRISKRKFVVERAKELLKNLIDNTMPDSQELADEVAYSVRVMEVQEYGKDRLTAGPAIDESDDIIIVEGRADVLNLLKHGIKNSIAMNGTSVPQTIIELSRKKEVTVFVDGDRGGDLIIKELLGVADIDFVCKAPVGKEVEEITKKEIHQCLRARIAVEQAKMEIGSRPISQQQGPSRPEQHSNFREQRPEQRPMQREEQRPSFQQRPPMAAPAPVRKAKLNDAEKAKFKGMLEDLIGTRGAYILDKDLNILGKVPLTELATTVKSLGSGVNAVIFDGSVEKALVETAENAHINFLIGMDSKFTGPARVNILTAEDL
ncbi:MAG: DNA primase DnaG [Candidatus Woesearchaeota archaeon]|nr:DNA primase DnaG [Candidatus Woesearchaeota archaeon]